MHGICIFGKLPNPEETETTISTAAMVFALGGREDSYFGGTRFGADSRTLRTFAAAPCLTRPTVRIARKKRR